VLGAWEIIRDIYHGLNFEDDGLDRAVRVLSGRELIVVQLPELELDREQTIKEILHLDIKVTNIVTQKLRSDLARLTPFRTDSPEEVRRKWLAVQEDEKQLRSLWRDAIATARQESSAIQDLASASSASGGSRIPLDRRFADRGRRSGAVDLRGAANPRRLPIRHRPLSIPRRRVRPWASRQWGTRQGRAERW